MGPKLCIIWLNLQISSERERERETAVSVISQIRHRDRKQPARGHGVLRGSARS